MGADVAFLIPNHRVPPFVTLPIKQQRTIKNEFDIEPFPLSSCT
jgi:hypothetical protein